MFSTVNYHRTIASQLTVHVNSSNSKLYSIETHCWRQNNSWMWVIAQTSDHKLVSLMANTQRFTHQKFRCCLILMPTRDLFPTQSNRLRDVLSEHHNICSTFIRVFCRKFYLFCRPLSGLLNYPDYQISISNQSNEWPFSRRKKKSTTIVLL